MTSCGLTTRSFSNTHLVTGLGVNDILFVDDSHRVFTDNDCAVFFLEILPRRDHGVIVHVHDIFLPYDYPTVGSKRHFSEQYLLASYLLAGCSWLRTLLPLAYLGTHSEGSKLINAAWADDPFQAAFANYRRLTGGYIGTSYCLQVLSR